MVDLIYFPTCLLLIFSTYIFLRRTTALIHELGHAVPALMFTNEKVSIFLGSYGDISKCKCFKIGKRLYFYFRLNPLKWNFGMVKHASVSSSFLKSLLILLLGPLSSFIIASTALWIAFSFNLHGAIKLFTIFFLYQQ